MNAIFQKQRRSSIVAALVTLALGLVLIFWPDHTAAVLGMLLGGALLAVGLIYVLGWTARRRGEEAPVYALIPGVVLCALGLWLLREPLAMAALVQYIFGAVLIFHGVIDLQGGLALMRMGWRRWWADLLLGVVTVLLGLVVLANPFAAFDMLLMLLGCSLVFDGLSDLYLIWRITRAVREQERDDG